MTIHHVFAAANYSASCSATAPRVGVRPTSATFTNQVGVALMSGMRSDLFAYTQVAGRSWIPSNLTAASNTYKIDSADESGIGSGKGYQWDIINIPLVGAGGRAFKNSAAQGILSLGAERIVIREPDRLFRLVVLLGQHWAENRLLRSVGLLRILEQMECPIQVGTPQEMKPF